MCPGSARATENEQDAEMLPLEQLADHVPVILSFFFFSTVISISQKVAWHLCDRCSVMLFAAYSVKRSLVSFDLMLLPIIMFDLSLL
jgi:hypothetical protein